MTLWPYRPRAGGLSLGGGGSFSSGSTQCQDSCPSPSKTDSIAEAAKTQSQRIASQGGWFGLPFLELGRATGKLSQEGRERQRRKQPQRRQRRSESRLSQWQAGQRSMGKARDPIRVQREQLRRPATISEDLPNSHAGGQFCSSPSRSGVEFGSALGEKPLWN